MQKIKTLYDQPIVSDDGSPPTTVKVAYPLKMEYVGGTTKGTHKTVTYVLFDVLPEELRRKIVAAVDALTSAM